MTAQPSRAFLPFTKWDRNFFLAMLVLILAGVVTGFGWDVVDRLSHHTANWPILVHIHAVAFVIWLVLLSTQIVLVRTRNIDLHKRLGLFGAGWAVVMLILAISVSWFMDIRSLGTKHADPSFLAIQLNDIILFPTLVAAGLWLRNRDSSAHKRLLVLATIAISDAGFARIGFNLVHGAFDHGFWRFWVASYTGPTLLVLAMGAYDFITRKRLHPAWLTGGAAIIAGEMLATWLYVSPWWKSVALKLLGH
ncbi:MAG TPA: hypothetical protein VG407_08625 [Caulobacteraceae bacterium]|jgi:uncharacterized membrane protein YozB (DUF420 family)|nr:hypothetical protein [Caulobacteraceae bacterium]